MSPVKRSASEPLEVRPDGGGDPACWAGLLCLECGAVLDGTGHRPGCSVGPGGNQEGPVLRFQVPPRHCDAQGLMHASRPYEYFEDAFLAWLGRACGGYDAVRAGGVDFVIVESACSYTLPARLGDVIDVDVRPTGAGTSSFRVEIPLTRGADAIAMGTVTYVTVRDGQPSAIPASLRTAMGDVPELKSRSGRPA